MGGAGFDDDEMLGGGPGQFINLGPGMGGIPGMMGGPGGGGRRTQSFNIHAGGAPKSGRDFGQQVKLIYFEFSLHIFSKIVSNLNFPTIICFEKFPPHFFYKIFSLIFLMKFCIF